MVGFGGFTEEHFKNMFPHHLYKSSVSFYFLNDDFSEVVLGGSARDLAVGDGV
jgi:hypothetical protein